MPNQNHEPFDWDQTTPAQRLVILDLLADDGHSIYPAQWLFDHGVPLNVIVHFCQIHASSPRPGDFKNQITVNGLPVDAMTGAYGLEILWSLARHYNVSSDKMGRGFQASDLTHRLRRHLKSPQRRQATG